MTTDNHHIGSSLDDLLAEDGTLDEMNAKSEAKARDFAQREALERLTRWRDCMGAKLGGSPQVPDAQFSGDVVALLSLVEKQQEALKVLEAEKREIALQAVADFGQLQEACEARDALSLQVARLKEAMKPFAAMADHYDRHYGNRPREPHHTVMQVATHDVGEHEITVGDFRSARSALSNPTGGVNG